MDSPISSHVAEVGHSGGVLAFRTKLDTAGVVRQWSHMGEPNLFQAGDVMALPLLGMCHWIH